MIKNKKIYLEEGLNYTKNIVLSFVVLFAGLFLIPNICMVIFLKFADPATFYSLVALAPTQIDSLPIQFAILLFMIAPYVAFIIWIFRDSRKFVTSGVNARPILWAIGMIFPLIFIFFPLYFIRRNITWLKNKQEIDLKDENTGALKGWYIKTDLVNENTKMKINKVGSALKWTAVVLVGSFGLLVLLRTPSYFESKNTAEQVAKIHATKLTIDDVMGKYLPPDPGAEADKTVAGIDVNKNGIRDDVELAIFKEYPNSAKTRAVLLQYALALQMEATQPIVNKETVTEVAMESGRADTCLSDTLVPRKSPDSWRTGNEVGRIGSFVNFVKNKHLNTELRKKAQHDFYQGNLGSYGDSTNTICDIDHLVLPN